MAAEWDTALTKAVALAKDVSYLISDRDDASRSGKATGEVSSRIRASAAQLDRAIDKLDADLKVVEANPTSYRLTPRDVASKRDALRRLATERTRLKNAERSAPGPTERDLLLGGARAAASTGASRETEATRDMTTGQLMDQVRAQEKAQDELLDQMSKGVDALKNMGHAIKDETDLHMRLLDRMEGEVDRADNALQRETARAKYMTEQSRTCWLYAAICLLLVILVVLIVAKWH